MGHVDIPNNDFEKYKKHISDSYPVRSPRFAERIRSQLAAKKLKLMLFGFVLV